MASQKSTLYFRTLAALAIFLLWGISLVNGTVVALILTVWNGQLPDGTHFETNYTGLFLLDFPIGLLVAFFYYGTNGHDTGYQVFLTDAYSTLQSAYIWLYVESFRPGAPKWVGMPIVFGLLWQAFGAAISLPLYYAIHLEWVAKSASDSRSTTRAGNPNLDKVRALPLAFLVGAVFPTVMGMAPGTWLGPTDRPATVHQLILAAWQPDPIWVSLLLAVGTNVAAALRGARGASSGAASHRAAAHRWARGAYLLGAASSAFGHLYVVWRMLSAGRSESAVLDWVRMYVPFPLSGGPAGAGDILVRGPWLFLQFDLIIIGLSSVSWAFLLLRQLGKTVSDAVLALIMIVGTLTVGPGAVVSLALFVREGYLLGGQSEE